MLYINTKPFRWVEVLEKKTAGKKQPSVSMLSYCFEQQASGVKRAEVQLMYQCVMYLHYSKELFEFCGELFYTLKYNFVETPRKFIIAKLSIRKLGSSSVLIMWHYAQ